MMQQNDDVVIIRRLKKQNVALKDQYAENLENWAAYWRANPHRFITEYLGLTLYDFQKLLIYQMNFIPNYIFIGSRGIAKSSVTLLFSC